MSDWIAIVVAAFGLFVLTWILVPHLRASQATAVSPVTGLALYFLIFYGVGGTFYALAEPLDPRQIVTSGSVQVAALSGLGFAAMMVLGASAAAGQARDFRNSNEDFSTPSDPMLLCLLAVGWLMRGRQIVAGDYFHVAAEIEPSGSRWIVSVFAALPQLVLLVLYLRRLRGDRGSPTWALVILLVSVELAWALPSGQRSTLLGPVVGIAVLHAYVKGLDRRVLLALGGVAALIVLPAMTIISQYRGNSAEAFEADPIGRLVATSGDFWSDPADGYATSSELLMRRLSDTLPFAVALDRGLEEAWPAGQFETLTNAPYAAVPRRFFPNKPDPGRFGNDFGHETGLVAAWDVRTTITSGLPIEFYRAGGAFGILIGGAAFGFGINSFSQFLAGRATTSAKWLVILAHSTLPLVRSPATIFGSGVLGSLRQVVAVALVWTCFELLGKLVPAVRVGLTRGSASQRRETAAMRYQSWTQKPPCSAALGEDRVNSTIQDSWPTDSRDPSLPSLNTIQRETHVSGQ